MWKSNIFIGSYLLACTHFWIRKSLIFALFSLGKLSHAVLVLYLELIPKHGLKWQKGRACKLGQNIFGDAYFWSFIPMVWFPHSSSRQVQQPSIPSPTTIDMLTTVDGSKPILNLVSPIGLHIWKSIIFIGSYFLACRSFWIRKKFNFRPLLSRQTESCYTGFVCRTDAEAGAQVAEEECM